MTTPATPVDIPPRAVMWAISQVAERDRVSRQAVSKHVRRLADEHELAVERDAQGRIIAFNVTQYDSLRGRFSDPSKAQGPSAPPVLAVGESYEEALRQKTWYEAERKRIDLDKESGRLVEADRLSEALASTAEGIARVIDRLPNIADELATAIAQEGAHGGRVLLRRHATRLRAEIADALVALAAGRQGESGPETP